MISIKWGDTVGYHHQDSHVRTAFAMLPVLATWGHLGCLKNTASLFFSETLHFRSSPVNLLTDGCLSALEHLESKYSAYTQDNVPTWHTVSFPEKELIFNSLESFFFLNYFIFTIHVAACKLKSIGLPFELFIVIIKDITVHRNIVLGKERELFRVEAHMLCAEQLLSLIIALILQQGPAELCTAL